MRVLHVVPSLSTQTGGPALNTVETAYRCNMLGVESSIVTTDALTPAQSEKALGGATLADFPPNARHLDIRVIPLGTPKRLAFSPAMRRYLNDNISEFDLLHIHSLNLYPQFISWRSAISHSVPYLVTPHGALDPWVLSQSRARKILNDRLWQRRMINGAAALHFTTNDEMDLVEGCGYTSPKHVVPNGLDLSVFDRSFDGLQFRKTWLDGYSGTVILNHGRISRKKGLDILVRAFAIAQQHTECRLVLIGPDHEGVGEELVSIARCLGVDHALKLVPELSGEELRDAVSSATVWVLPSHGENFGMSVVEAMALGKAVITSKSVNISGEASEHQAMIVADSTPHEIAKEIGCVIHNHAKRAKLGSNASMFVRRFDWNEVAKQYVEMYHSSLEFHRVRQ